MQEHIVNASFIRHELLSDLVEFCGPCPSPRNSVFGSPALCRNSPTQPSGFTRIP